MRARTYVLPICRLLLFLYKYASVIGETEIKSLTFNSHIEIYKSKYPLEVC